MFDDMKTCEDCGIETVECRHVEFIACVLQKLMTAWSFPCRVAVHQQAPCRPTYSGWLPAATLASWSSEASSTSVGYAHFTVAHCHAWSYFYPTSR